GVGGPAPRCPFLSPASCPHLPDHARQHIGRMLPPDDVKTLESLIDEVERMSAIGVGAVRLGGKEEICECRRRGTRRNRRQHGSFGSITVPHGCPAPQPALQGGK